MKKPSRNVTPDVSPLAPGGNGGEGDEMALQYAVKRGEHFSFRIKIPSDLHQYFPSSVLQVALGTNDKKEAKKLIAGWYSKVSGIFQSLRNEFLSEEVKRELVHSSVYPKKKKTAKTQIRRLSHLIEEYLKDGELNEKWRPKSLQEVKFSLKLFCDVLGDIPVSHLDRDRLKEFKNTIMALPANFTKNPKYRDKSISQLLKMPDITPMSRTSVNKHINWVSSLLNFAVQERYIPLNYAENLNVKREKRPDEERKIYTKEDLQKIVNHLQWEEGYPERYWIPLIGLFQGMRLNEIASLYVEDIKEIKGIPCFDINDKRDDKMIKNDASRRVVPIHPTLLSLGFLDYVKKAKEQKQPRLWMNLKKRRDGYAHDFGKWYQNFNRKFITEDPQKVFHSFRHSFINFFKQKRREDVKMRESIVGHKSSESQTDDRYGKAFEPKPMLEFLKLLDYELDLSSVKLNHFKPWTPEEKGRPSRPLIID